MSSRSRRARSAAAMLPECEPPHTRLGAPARVDDLEDVGRADHAGGDLHAAGPPSVRQRHLPAAERNLVAGDSHRLEDGAADHALALLVEEREVVLAHTTS